MSEPAQPPPSTPRAVNLKEVYIAVLDFLKSAYHTRGYEELRGEVRAILTSKGWNVNGEGTWQGHCRNLLDVACKYWNLDMARMFIDLGADVNAPLSRRKCSTLHIAVARQFPEGVDLLLSRGATVDTLDEYTMFETWIISHLTDPLCSCQSDYHREGPCRNTILRLLDAGASVLSRKWNKPAFLVSALENVAHSHSSAGNSAVEEILDAVLQAGIPLQAVPEDVKYYTLTLSVASQGIIKKLTVVGFDFYSEKFVREVETQGDGAKPGDREMVVFLKEHALPSLSSLCRQVLRSALIANRPPGTHLNTRIDSLPLPQSVKNFLKLKDGSLPKLIN